MRSEVGACACGVGVEGSRSVWVFARIEPWRLRRALFWLSGVGVRMVWSALGIVDFSNGVD